MSAYHTPAEPVLRMAGRPMAWWREDTKGAREDMARGVAQAKTNAPIHADRRPTQTTKTGDYKICVVDRYTVHAIIEAAYSALYEAINALEAARQAVDTAHQRLGYIPSEWTRADTIRWSERPELWGCTEEDVARVDRIRAEGIFHTPTQESQP